MRSADKLVEQGLAALNHGRFIEARRSFKNALKIQPEHVGALNLLTVVLMSMGRFAEAEEFIAKAVRLDQRSDASFYNYGIILKRLKKPALALAQFDNALRLNPTVAEIWNNRGTVLNDLNRYEDAIVDFNKAIALQPNYGDAYCNKGNSLSMLNRYGEALAAYDAALAVKSDLGDAWLGRGIVLADLNRNDEALAAYDTALAVKPDLAEAWLGRGNIFRNLKCYEEAFVAYDRALAIKPDLQSAWLCRGDACTDRKRFEEAFAAYDKALALKPDLAEAWLGRGNVFYLLKRYDEALAAYDEALALKADSEGAWLGRGNVLHLLQRYDEALAAHDKALALKPDLAEAWLGRGYVLAGLQRHDEAFAAYDKALELKPDLAEAWLGRGNIFHALTRNDEAFAAYNKALELKPDLAEAWFGRGNILCALTRHDEAVASYEKAVAFKPDFAEAHYNLGTAFGEQGRRAEAAVHYQRALTLKADYAEAEFAVCMAQLPILYTDEPEIARRRAAYQKCLEALCDDVDRRMLACDFAKAVGSRQPFFLAYQGYNDRDLQSLYGSLVCRIMAERYPPAALSPPPQSNEPVRLGVVSGFFREHSVWKIPIKGWLSQIDRRRFRISGYHTGVHEDAETKQAIALCDRFVQGPLSIDRWRQAILDDAPHVLIYPEVGMDPISAQLAAQRLAPVQCNSWGHPDTSGFPTLDYYLSSELMEPSDAQDHYTERLVRLPNLSIYYEPFDLQPVLLNRTDLGLRSTATVYWCGQSLYKYLPQFDQVFPRIAREAGDCQFIFIQNHWTYLNELFLRRLDRAFAAFGLRTADYCVFVPRLDANRFVAAIGQCDIVLDSIGWSGCNSTLEGLHHDLPIVTMTAPLMRGRHTTAILKMMGVGETITETVDDYVSTAIRLARDAPWRTAVKTKIAENKHRAYRDTACVSALQEFMERSLRNIDTNRANLAPGPLPSMGFASTQPSNGASVPQRGGRPQHQERT